MTFGQTAIEFMQFLIRTTCRPFKDECGSARMSDNYVLLICICHDLAVVVVVVVVVLFVLSFFLKKRSTSCFLLL